jgi:imidazole glycerol-phosphate synthase subunit HisH
MPVQRARRAPMAVLLASTGRPFFGDHCRIRERRFLDTGTLVHFSPQGGTLASQFPLTGIIDYKAGNARSVQRALDYLAVPNRMLTSPDGLAEVDRVILPGVGAAGTTIQYLADAGWPQALQVAVADGDMPFLGICVGLQVLFQFSEEQDADCLGWLPGTVRRLDAPRVPHMGWNQVRPGRGHPFAAAIPDGEHFYFVNSYVVPADCPGAAAVTDYEGTVFASVVTRRNIMATQFHAEKSGPAGLALLGRFAALTREELCP